MMFKKKGISLIVLVITIIIILILAAAIILSLSQNNPFDTAREARWKMDAKTIHSEVSLYIATATANRETTVFPVIGGGNNKLDPAKVSTLIPELVDKLEIIQDKLVFTGTDEKERQWAREIGLLPDLNSAVNNGSAMQISAGGEYSTVLLADGTVKNFGENSNNQLGNNTGNDTNEPEYVKLNNTDNLADVKYIESGESKTLAILEDDTIVGWGENYDESLGNTQYNSSDRINNITSNFANQVDLFPGKVVSMAALNNGTIAEISNHASGYGYAWDNITGQTSVSKLTANFDNNVYMATLNNGNVIVAGYDDNDASMHGTGVVRDYNSNARSVVSVSNPTQVVVSNTNSYFLMPDKTVKAAGSYNYGQLGNGVFGYDDYYDTTPPSATPTTIPGLNSVKQIAAGDYHALALLENGTIVAWGYNNYGQLGIGSYDNASTPTLIDTLTNVVQISAGRNHSMALTADGKVYTWGYNNSGQLGTGDNSNRIYPTEINMGDPLPPTPRPPLDTTVMQVAAGGNFSAVLYKDTTVGTFGYNTSGELGVGSTTHVNIPTYVKRQDDNSVLFNAKKISCGYNNTVIQMLDNTAMGFGESYGAQLGSNASEWNPNKFALTIIEFPMIKDIAAAGRFTYAIKPNNKASYVGGAHLNLPDLSSLSNIKQFSGNWSSGIALLENGTAWGWGGNNSGCLGVGYTDPYSSVTTPMQVISNLNISQVSSNGGGDNFYFIMSDKTLRASGANGNGQLGDGTTSDSNEPIVVAGVNNVKQVAAGTGFVLALLENGTVMGWGDNYEGQLGLGNEYEERHANPTLITGLNNIVQVAAGDSHSLALAADGTVYAWGDNFYGQLGDGTNTRRLTPTVVNLSTPGEYVEPPPPPTPPKLSNYINGDTVNLQFTSDGSVTRMGFRITGINYMIGGTEYNETLSSPVELINYSDNANWSNSIYKSGAESIQLIFEFFESEGGYDYLYLRDSGMNTIQVLEGSPFGGSEEPN